MLLYFQLQKTVYDNLDADASYKNIKAATILKTNETFDFVYKNTACAFECCVLVLFVVAFSWMISMAQST